MWRSLLWPIDRWAPYRRSRLEIVRKGGLGDVLMCTPALRELKRANPMCYVIFFTGYKTLVEGLPYIDEVRDASDCPDAAITLSYQLSVPPRRHIASILGDYLGVRVDEVRPDCVVDEELVLNYLREWDGLPRPRIIVSRYAGPWTPNKDWHEEYWHELLEDLVVRNTVIEIGDKPAEFYPASSRYVNYVGKTSIEQLVAIMAAADLHIGPMSGPVHIAAAVQTPAVVIYGGYEHPICSSYPGNLDLYTPIACSPCWLREPCPIGKLCLGHITPSAVNAAADLLWKRAEMKLASGTKRLLS